MRFTYIAALLSVGLVLNSAQAQVPSAQPQRPPKIPAEIFAAQPTIVEPVLSPDGNHLLFHYEKDGKNTIVAQDLTTGTLFMRGIPEKSELAWYRWAGNDRILASVSSTVSWFDDEAKATRLVLLDLKANTEKFLGKKDEGLEGDDVLYVDPSGGWLLLSIQQTIYDYPSVYRVDLTTFEMTQIVRQRSDVWEWYADDKGVVRLGIGFDSLRWTMVYRRSVGEGFRRVLNAKYDDKNALLSAYHFTQESDTGYVLSNEKSGCFGVYKYDFIKRELGDLVYESPTNDIEAFDLADDNKSVKSVWFTDDRDRVVWFDPALKTDQDEIDGALKDRLNWIVSRTRDDSRMIVLTYSATDPGSYYLYQPSAGAMRRIAKFNDKINPRQLASTRYVKYTARDGLEIPAYLTLPVGREAKKLPLILFPHGGPYDVRDKLGFDPEVQFLANRGYAVLQPNYRGSGSYGETFYKSGEGQIGRKMQDDLDDGMDWLVKSGIADAKRVCIIGASYGGYAALWGATRNPERYRCAASFAGVTDYKRQLGYDAKSFASTKYSRDWRNTVRGAKDFDLDSVSPLKLVGQLNVPVLIAHGDADTRVLYKQSQLYDAALQKAGKPHEFYTFKGEGHGFSEAAHLKEWLERLDAFLAKYNPAD
jgi:dipeptidyl aminopeptidase/acylaminoacyl peptidase